MTEALRLPAETAQADELWKQDVRRKIEDVWRSLERGEVFDGETVFDRIEAELETLIRTERE